MEIKFVKETIYETVNIDLPYYFKDTMNSYLSYGKIEESKTTIINQSFNYDKDICAEFNVEHGEPCELYFREEFKSSEEEFLNAAKGLKSVFEEIILQELSK